jgi:hypothetical protein
LYRRLEAARAPERQILPWIASTCTHITWPPLLQGPVLTGDCPLRTQTLLIRTRPWDNSPLRLLRRLQSSLQHIPQRPRSRPCASTPREASADATPRNTRWPTYKHQSRYARSYSTLGTSSLASRRPMLRHEKCRRYAFASSRDTPASQASRAGTAAV